jgi:ribosomal protein L34E
MKYYAGKVCQKCGIGANNDRKISGIDELYKKQEKRYGGYVCSSCIEELAGGKEAIKKMRTNQILKEMGLNK